MASQPDRPSRLLDPEFTDPDGPYQNPDHPRHADAVADLAQIAKLARGHDALPVAHTSAADPLLPTPLPGPSGPTRGPSAGDSGFQDLAGSAEQLDVSPDEPESPAPSLPAPPPLGSVGVRLAHMGASLDWGDLISILRPQAWPKAADTDDSRRPPNSENPSATSPGAPSAPPALETPAASEIPEQPKPPRHPDAPDGIIEEIYVRTANGDSQRLHFTFDNTVYGARTINEWLHAAMVQQPPRRGSRSPKKNATVSTASPASPEPRPPKTTPPDLPLRSFAWRAYKEFLKVHGISVDVKDPNVIGPAGEDALAERAEKAGFKIVGRGIKCVLDDGSFRVFDILLADDNNGLAGIKVDTSGLLHVDSKANTGRRKPEQRRKDEVIATQGCRIESAKKLKYGYKRGDWIIIPTLEMPVTVAYPR